MNHGVASHAMWWVGSKSPISSQRQTGWQQCDVKHARQPGVGHLFLGQEGGAWHHAESFFQRGGHRTTDSELRHQFPQSLLQPSFCGHGLGRLRTDGDLDVEGAGRQVSHFVRVGVLQGS